MTDEELLRLNLQGFIPGPGETEESFRKRVRVAEGGEPPSEWVCLHLEQLFGFRPIGLSVVYSNQNLAPWQGAAVWVEGRAVKSIQLREGLKKGVYLGLYEAQEILAHEAVHAARAAFDESVNEEFFAYMTSQKRWQRILGPIVRRPWEVWPILVSGVLGAWWPAFYWGVTVWMGVGFVRLIRQHARLRRAAKVLGKNARAILLRLTDKEIERLARGEKLEAGSDLRWRLLRLAYGLGA